MQELNSRLDAIAAAAALTDALPAQSDGDNGDIALNDSLEAAGSAEDLPIAVDSYDESFEDLSILGSPAESDIFADDGLFSNDNPAQGPPAPLKKCFSLKTLTPGKFLDLLKSASLTAS